MDGRGNTLVTLKFSTFLPHCKYHFSEWTHICLYEWGEAPKTPCFFKSGAETVDKGTFRDVRTPSSPPGYRG